MLSVGKISQDGTVLRAWRGKNESVFVRAQHNAIARLIPVLYVVVAIVTFSLSLSLASTAPLWLSIGIPNAMLIPIALRLRYWISVRDQSETMPIEKIRRDIRHTNYIGPVIAFIFTGIGTIMLVQGSGQNHELAGIAIWVLAITSSFCLAATPFASIAIVLSAATPLTLSFAMADNHVLQTMAGVVVLVSAQVVYMLLRNYVSFFEMVLSKDEIQKRKEAAETAEQASTLLANTDHLTGLPNRRSFERMLSERSIAAKTAGDRFAVGVLDLDGFKPVNDVYGHSAGDEVLVEVANRLRQELASNSDIARLGGDEFAFMLRFTTQTDLLHLLNKILLRLSEHYFVQANRVVRVASSIGVAVYNAKTQDPLRLIDQADIALYQSKTNGRAMSTLFSPEMELANLERARIEQGLRRAISSGELEAHFQPIFEILSHQLVGFEALARWTDPDLGTVSPAIFIPIAEHSGLIGPLTELMLRKAATAAAEWPEHLYLSFNVSAEQLVRESAGLKIITLLAECGLAPNRLEVEVTESALMKDINSARHTIENLKAAGARISLDDFGTGYSSLSQIRSLPLDKVKIDKSFIDYIVSDEKTRNLVTTIVTMCEALNITCTAEGIEQEVQLDALKKAGCHSGQGYLFARPLTLPQVHTLIQEHASWPNEGILKQAS